MAIAPLAFSQVTTASVTGDDPRAELERLRKMKRLQELEAKASGQPAMPVPALTPAAPVAPVQQPNIAPMGGTGEFDPKAFAGIKLPEQKPLPAPIDPLAPSRSLTPQPMPAPTAPPSRGVTTQYPEAMANKAAADLERERKKIPFLDISESVRNFVAPAEKAVGDTLNAGLDVVDPNRQAGKWLQDTSQFAGDIGADIAAPLSGVIPGAEDAGRFVGGGLQEFAGTAVSDPMAAAGQANAMLNPTIPISEGWNQIVDASGDLLDGVTPETAGKFLQGTLNTAAGAMGVIPQGSMIVSGMAKKYAAQRIAQEAQISRVASGMKPAPVAAAGMGGKPPPIAPGAAPAVVPPTNPLPSLDQATRRAADLMLKKLAADGITIDDIAKTAAALNRKGDSGIYETIGEVAGLTGKTSGANLRGLQMAGGSVPGPLQEALVGQVNANTAALPKRINRAATRATGQSADAAVDTLQALDRRLKTESGPKYEAFFSSPVRSDTFTREILPILNTEAGQVAAKQALAAVVQKEARLRARVAGGKATATQVRELEHATGAMRSLEAYLADPVTGTAVPSPYAMDRIKRAFDNQVEAAGQGSEIARDIRGTKSDFAESVSNATGGTYGEALGFYEGQKRLRDAFDFGTAALNKKTWQLKEEMATGLKGRAWSTGEIEAVAMGVARNIEDLIEANDQSALTKLLKGKALENLSTSLGSEKAAKMFEDSIRRIAANREWGRRVAGGSDTAMRQAAIKDASTEGEDAITRALDKAETGQAPPTMFSAAWDALGKPAVRAAKDAYQQIRYPGIYNEEVNAALAPMLGRPMTKGNVESIAATLKAREAEKAKGLLGMGKPAPAPVAPKPAPKPNPKKPLPGQTSPASPTGTGIVAGGVIGASAPADSDQERLRNAAIGAGALGVVGAGAGRLAKAAPKPPKPPVPKAPVAFKRDPAMANLSPGDMVGYIEAKYPPAAPNLQPPYFTAANAIKRANGDRAAATKELADYAAYLKQSNSAPEVIENAERTVRAVADVDPIFFDDAAFNASMKGRIEAGGTAAMEQMDKGAASSVTPLKPAPKPPTRQGFGSSKLPMDEGAKTWQRQQWQAEKGPVDDKVWFHWGASFDAIDPAKNQLGLHVGSKRAAWDRRKHKAILPSQEKEQLSELVTRGDFAQAPDMDQWTAADYVDSRAYEAGLSPDARWFDNRFPDLWNELDAVAKSNPTQEKWAEAVRDATTKRGLSGWQYSNTVEDINQPSRIIMDPTAARRTDAKFDPAESSSSKLLAGLGGPSGAGAAGGGILGYTLNPADANNDGVIDDLDRGLNGFGGMVSGGIAGKALGSRAAGKFGNRKQGFVGGGIRYGKDPTKTENIFRDNVGKPFNSDREATKRLNRLFDNGNYIDTKLPTHRLYATQENVHSGYAENTSNRYVEGAGGVEAPAVVKYKGNYYVTDGHHRITKAVMDGKSNVRVRLYDVDGDTALDTPLLDFNPERHAKDRAEIKMLLDELFADAKPVDPSTPDRAGFFGSGKAESRPKPPPAKGPPKPKPRPVEARRAAPRGNKPFSDPRLSPGENKTAEMILNGHTYEEIADEMITSVDVVKKQASNAQKKLGADVQLPRPGMGKRPPGSTKREAAFELFDSGVDNAQIAERLGMTIGNVKTYRSYWREQSRASVASVEGAAYNPPAMPERPFEADYPQKRWPNGPPVDAQGRLTRDMDGNPLDQTSVVIGRNKAPGNGPKSEADRSLRDRIAVIQSLKKAGSSLERVPRSSGKASGGWRPDFDANGRFTGRGSTQIVDDLDQPITGLDDQEVIVLSHELAHSIDFKVNPSRNTNDFNNRKWGIDHKNPYMTPEIKAELESQLQRIYRDLNNPIDGEVKIRTPKDRGYGPIDEDRELWAEAIRAYMYDPNYIKTVAPDVAFMIRDHVNRNSSLRKTIQFNAVPTIVGVGGLGLGAAALSSQPAEAQKR